MPKRIGYARVSTPEQSLAAQRAALKGCKVIYTDTASGSKSDRPGLARALGALKAGDTLIVTRLDRLGRTVGGLIELAADLKARKVHLKSLSEGIDTSTAAGIFMFHMLAALAQMERELIAERTKAGLAIARANGIPVGRPRAMTEGKARAARALYAAGHTTEEVLKYIRVSASTLQRHLPAADRQVDLVAMQQGLPNRQAR